MIQIYVTKMPRNKSECPFWDDSNQHCNVNSGCCCLDNVKTCGHLLNLEFGFEELAEEISEV